MIRDLVAFRSARFAPALPEACQVNPGRHGFELAWWLAQGLQRRHGIATGYPAPEDWGWLLEYAAPSGGSFALHVGNLDGTTDRWLISIGRRRRLLGRDRGDFAGAAGLVAAIRRLLDAEDGVAEIEWAEGWGGRPG